MWHILLLLSCLFLLASCDEGATDTPLPGERAFKDGYVYLTAEPVKAVTDRPITVTTWCYPRIPGTGKLTLEIRSEYLDDTIYVVSPVLDTLYRPFRVVEDPMAQKAIAEFITDGEQQLQVEWVVQLRRYPEQRSYHLFASVRLDSVFISDSNRMYHYLDPVIYQYYPEGISPSGSTLKTLTLAQK